MKITRFINGKKLDTSFPRGLVVESEVMLDTISKVNSRVQKRDNKNSGAVNG